MLDKILAALKADVRDIVLAGVAAGSGYLISQAVPKTGNDLKLLLVGAAYCAIRAAVAFAAALLSK